MPVSGTPGFSDSAQQSDHAPRWCATGTGISLTIRPFLFDDSRSRLWGDRSELQSSVLATRGPVRSVGRDAWEV